MICKLLVDMISWLWHLTFQHFRRYIYKIYTSLLNELLLIKQSSFSPTLKTFFKITIYQTKLREYSLIYIKMKIIPDPSASKLIKSELGNDKWASWPITSQLYRTHVACLWPTLSLSVLPTHIFSTTLGLCLVLGGGGGGKKKKKPF